MDKKTSTLILFSALCVTFSSKDLLPHGNKKYYLNLEVFTLNKPVTKNKFKNKILIIDSEIDEHCMLTLVLT